MLPRITEGLLRRVGATIYRAGLAGAVYALNPRAPRVILYHACEPKPSDFTEGLATSLPPDTLAMHLAFFRRHYNVVAPEALEQDRELPPHPLVVTFDDGYRSVYDHAYPRLVEAGVPATVYLITGVIEEGLVWVNELNWWLRRHPHVARPRLARAFRQAEDASPAEMIDKVRECFDPRRVEHVLEDIRRTAGRAAEDELRREPLYLTWSQIRSMQEHGIRFGCHTVSHPSLPRLTPEEQRREIHDARAEIVRRLGSCTSFAFPFGDVDTRSRAAAIEVGFESLMEVGGTNRPWDPTRIARIPVTALTPAELFAEIEILAPLRGVARSLSRGLRRSRRSARLPPLMPQD